MHAHGKTGVVDKEEARKWLKIAAEGGAVKAQMFLAQMSTFGRGGYEKDEAVAFEYGGGARRGPGQRPRDAPAGRAVPAPSASSRTWTRRSSGDKAIELGSADAVKDREIAQKKKNWTLDARRDQEGPEPAHGRGEKSKRNTVESSLRIKAASAPLKSPSSSRQTSRQSTPAQSPVASPTIAATFEEEEACRRRPPVRSGPRRPPSGRGGEAPRDPRALAARAALRRRRGLGPVLAASARTSGDAGGGGPGACSCWTFAFAYGAIVLIGVGLAVAPAADGERRLVRGMGRVEHARFTPVLAD